jgi:hypothetical protein
MESCNVQHKRITTVCFSKQNELLPITKWNGIKRLGYLKLKTLGSAGLAILLKHRANKMISGRNTMTSLLQCMLVQHNKARTNKNSGPWVADPYQEISL